MKKLLLLPMLLLLGFAAGAQAVASFTAAYAPQSNNLLRWNFHNTSTYCTGGTAGWNTATINYGDGTTSQLPASGTYGHNYSAPGTYTVGLRIRRIDSLTGTVFCTDTTTQIITVAYSPCASSYTTVVGSNGLRTFTASTPGATGPMTYTWNFGDGGTGAGSPVAHTFTANGTYIVVLYANGGGCNYVDTQYVYVQGAAANCANLHALFTTGVNNYTVSVTNTSTTGPGLTRVSSYLYGDGSAYTSATSHTYAAAGTYNVQLKVVWMDSVTQTVYCQDSITHQVYITSPPPPANIISGYIGYDSLYAPGPQQLRVWLIQYDSVTNSLAATDSLLVSGTPFIHFQFVGEPTGAYLLKAALLNQTAGNVGIVPTYHDTSLYWNTAPMIYHTAVTATYANIYMQTGTVTSGPGFVSGNVSLGANKGASSGVAGIQIYIRNAANALVACATTDANGDFSLHNLPAGTYNVYPEHLNYATTPAMGIVITNGAAQQTGINFNQDNTQKNIKPRNAAGITSVHGNDAVIAIAPNPTSKAVTLSWKGVDARGAHIIVTGITGSVLIDKTVAGTSSETLDVSSLRSGIYFVRGTEGLLGKAQKLVIE